MQEPDLITEGLNLLILGMGFVFVFLTLLVVATTLMSKSINHFFPEAEEPAPAKAGKAAALPTEQNSEVIAAISAAIHLHRHRNKN
ncbi:OadG family protein [Marinospirillum perlucidum]|uniref:OadG family protein n=1 Tax=Marinospirillum perlucidum TaxID=1982602 RepID=UPI000DF16760|nr:OadG family protein [Marinospirillum perlucidum]